MTSTPINDYPVMQTYCSNVNTDHAKTAETEEVSGSFQNVMKQVKSGQTDTGTITEQMTPVGKTGSTKLYNGISRNESRQVQQKDAVGHTQKRVEKRTEDVSDEAEKLEKEVVKKVADELDVTEEEVKEAMEALGLTVMDLMDQSNMAALVTQLTGQNDPMALLTDEDLFATIRQLSTETGEIIQQSIQELSDALDMDTDTVRDLLSEALAGMESVSADEAGISGKASQTGVVVEIETDLTEEKNVSESAVENVDEVSEDTDHAGETAAEAAEEQGGGQDQNTMNFERGSSPLINQMFQTQDVQTGEAGQTEMPFTSYVDTEDIINQIGEYVKIHRSEGLTEMEISLNPESLGNIHLQVSSREGMITATITTQNEAVRDALMLQAMTLKEELNEQGVRVEAVDVTVASHEFERNMQNGGEEAQNLFEQQVQKQTRRRLMIDNLLQAEEMLEDENLTDAERLQIDMMAKSGNSVDFTA